jgi:malate synthase
LSFPEFAMPVIDHVTITAPLGDAFETILTPDAQRFLVALHQKFDTRRHELLAKRHERQKRLDAGELPDFLPETKSVRESEWTVAKIPADLQNRKVEITGPVERKMIINALNSGANAFMADFEDSNSPTWDNNLQGQINLRDAINRTISFTNEAGKQYMLNDKIATLLVRPRGWHLDEKHFLVAGKPISGGILDFALYFFTNAKTLLAKGSGPYFYLPKMESHLEARLWNDIFNFAQDYINIPRGSIRATVLIETILAAFETDEILYELKDHSAGLNCGRWDYIFSFIKKLGKNPKFTLPDRAQVTMTVPFMRAYSLNVIKVCHRRGIHAMGGMAAQIPIKNDAAANDAAMEKVKSDKHREATDGHDGTWVAHPGLIPIAAAEFAAIEGANQIAKQRPDVHVTQADLLKLPEAGTITEAGVRMNLSVGIQYLEAWLKGNGCVPIYNLMEDAATAEISRAQLWQWLQHGGAKLDDGRVITKDLLTQLEAGEMEKLKSQIGERFEHGQFAKARELFMQMTFAKEFPEFLTSQAYKFV